MERTGQLQEYFSNTFEEKLLKCVLLVTYKPAAMRQRT